MAKYHVHRYDTNHDRYRCPIAGCSWTATGTQALTPSADLPACRDEDPATPATLAAAYPEIPEYQHPEDDLCGAETVFWPEDEGCDAVCIKPAGHDGLHEAEILGEWSDDGRPA